MAPLRARMIEVIILRRAGRGDPAVERSGGPAADCPTSSASSRAPLACVRLRSAGWRAHVAVRADTGCTSSTGTALGRVWPSCSGMTLGSPRQKRLPDALR